jgi:hypothetical protein
MGEEMLGFKETEKGEEMTLIVIHNTLYFVTHSTIFYPNKYLQFYVQDYFLLIFVPCISTYFFVYLFIEKWEEIKSLRKSSRRNSKINIVRRNYGLPKISLNSS